jgi:hypothetical protein
MSRFGARTYGLICTAAAVLFLTGCSSQGTVSGKVSFNGKPLPGGLVSLYDSEGQTRSGGIGKEGNYTVSNVAPGKAQVFVVTLSERPSIRQPENKNSTSLGEYVAIPPKYMDKDQSGITLDVKTGKQDFDIQMTGEVK